MTCIKCNQEFSEENHECLEVMDYEELMESAPVPSMAERVMEELAIMMEQFIGVTVTPESIESCKRKTVTCLTNFQTVNGLPEIDVRGLVDRAFEEVFPV